MLLVPLASLPSAQVASLLAISQSYAKCLLFQAKVDKLYLTRGVKLQEYSHTQCHVQRDVIHHSVNFVYSDENIGRLAWEARKHTPNRDPRWKELENVFSMRSLVLKHDVATMFKTYSEKFAMPGKTPIGRSMFYTIAKTITGGGKQQEARAGVDYIKVNFHTDNFVIVDKIIDVVAPLSDLDHILRDELLGLRSHVYTFLSYGYAAHAREGVRAAKDTDDHSHITQEHEAIQLQAYQDLETLLADPDKYDVPATQVEFVDHIRGQLYHCGLARGAVGSESNIANTHSPMFSLDLASSCKPNRSPKADGRLECNSCRSTFLFYDRLRRLALARLDEDPNRFAEMADVLLAIYQCERHSYRYMAHVMIAAQQAHRMKMAIAEMDCNTAYVVFDFKQKFLAKGFREGGDSYYGKKGMLWWGAGVHVKANKLQDTRSDEPIEKPYVEIDFSAEKVRLKGLQGNEVGCFVEDDDCGEGIEEEDSICAEDVGEEVDYGEMEEGGEHEMGYGGKVWDGWEQDIGEVGDIEEEVEDGGEVGDGVEEVEDGGDVGMDDMQEGDNDERMECAQEVEEDGGEVVENVETDNVALHFIDCIIQDEQKADANVVLSCLEAAMHVIRRRFPHLTKVIFQSDNAKNLAGKQTKLLLPHVCSAAGMKLVAYYHNEAQSGKDVCDTHFSHQQTRVNAYLAQGEGGRKVSTPKQLAVALMTTSISNTTVLLVKPDFRAPFRSTHIPSVVGISELYATQYITAAGKQQMKMYHTLGQKVPSVVVSIPMCHATSLIAPMGEDGINFTGVGVMLNSDNQDTCVQVRKEKRRYRKRCRGISHREELRVQMLHADEEAMKSIQAVYPQCADCHYHFKSQTLLDMHKCDGVREPRDALSIAMRHANELMFKMNLSLDGAIARASAIFVDDGGEIPYATFEPNFYSGWAHTRKNMHPELTSTVTQVINECWKAGECNDTGKVKISADGVFARLEEMQSQKKIRLSELPLVGKIRGVYQNIGTKPKALLAAGCKRGRHASDGGKKKPRVSFDELDVSKDLLKWTKPELEAYLMHYHLKKNGNKPELILRIQEHIAKTLQ